MQVDLNFNVEIFNHTGQGTYGVKVHIMPIELFLDFKFILFHPHKGEYELYPGSFKNKPTEHWKDKFEFSKQTSFYQLLLEEVVDEVEAYSGIIITRKSA